MPKANTVTVMGIDPLNARPGYLEDSLAFCVGKTVLETVLKLYPCELCMFISVGIYPAVDVQQLLLVYN